MVLPVLLPAKIQFSKEGIVSVKIQFVHSAFECLLRCSRFICLQRRRGGRAFPQQQQPASLALCLCPAARLLPLLLLALPRLEATQPLPPASPLTAYCCCTCSKLSVRTLPIFQHMPWKHTHALTKVRRNTSPPPTITRIFATTQIPITPCPETQLCSSEDKIILVF